MIQQTMIAVTSTWGEKKSFRLIPIVKECPYSEGIYDPESKVLVLMSCLTKETFHMMPRLDDNGDPMMSKIVREKGKRYKEHRVSLETFTEYYITEKVEIEEMLKLIAINADTFNFAQFMEDKKLFVPETKIEVVK